MTQIDKMFKNKLEHYTVDIPEGAWDNIAARLPENPKSRRPWWMIASIATVILVSAFSAWIMSDLKPTPSAAIVATADLDCLQSLDYHYVTGDYLNNKNEVAHDIDQMSAQQSDIVDKNIYLSEVIKKNVDVQKYNTSSYQSSDQISTSALDVQAFSALSGDKQVQITKLAVLTPIHNHINYAQDVKYPELITTSKSNLSKMKKGKDKDGKACPFVFDVQDKSVDVYFSNDINVKHLTANAEFAQYKSERINTETPIYSYSAGIRFGYNLSHRWNLHTGFNYSQINEKFQYIDPESNQTRIITIKDYVYENGKIVDSIVTEETVLVPGTSKMTVYNKYRTFDIPILARYTIYANKYLSLSGLTGIYINLALKERGMILNPDSKPIDITAADDQDQTIFKTQLGISGYASLSMAYHLTPNIDFLLEPNVRIQTEAMNTNIHPIDQNFTTFGLSTGLRYRF